jgi:magnesium chelatase subunit I
MAQVSEAAMQSMPQTLGALKSSGYTTRTVKDEMRDNLVRKLKSGERLFPGIVGYEDTVVPQIINAVLAKQNFILLGLRGQAKSRIVRQLITLLDEHIPIVAGSEVNDNPLHPISKFARVLIEEKGDATPVTWVPRESRFIEKLATPDVTIADVIGDLDPIKAARGGHQLSDELTIHYGLLPRANRGIFAINEVPDLSGKIQVGLFNIMQEGDVQIKGYPVRLPLDVLLVFTANPEDYTARGKIITPLKDRIGAEIMTHYPATVHEGMEITMQEAWTSRGASDGTLSVDVPAFVAETIERVAFLARTDKRVDHRSGVSQRMPITMLENAVSNAERRSIINGETEVVPRPTDVYAALPSITGKLELEYEGELVGAEKIARELIARAAGETFDAWGGESVRTQLDDVVDYFERGGILQLGESSSAVAALEGFRNVPALIDVTQELALGKHDSPGHTAAACELVLEALVAQRRLTRSEAGSYARSEPRRRPPKGGMGLGEPPTFEV